MQYRLLYLKAYNMAFTSLESYHAKTGERSRYKVFERRVVVM